MSHVDKLSIKKIKILDQLVNYSYENCNNIKRSIHCAAVVQNGKILTYGKNTSRSLLRRCCLTSIHAEVDALHKYQTMHSTNSKISLWVIRRSKNKLANSRPCSACLKSIKQFNIHKIYYSTSEGTICEMKVKEFNVSYETRVQNQFPEYKNSWHIFRNTNS